eukprot:COSAG01_NODE_2032_length_8583_cov_14.706271_5_plen_277_part_00
MLVRGCSVSRVSALSGSAAAAATAGRLCCLHSRGQGELGARLQHTEAQSSAGRSPGSHTDEDCFDVVVVGGGVVGATVACALATAPAACSMRLALLDAKPPPDISPPAPCAGWTVEEPPNARAYALSATSAEILDALGVWSEVCARPMGRFDRMQVWDEAGGGYVRLSAGQDGDNAGSGLGYIVEDHVLQGVLWLRLKELAEQRAGQMEILSPETVAHLTFPGSAHDATAAAAATALPAGSWPELELGSGRVIRVCMFVPHAVCSGHHRRAFSSPF